MGKQNQLNVNDRYPTGNDQLVLETKGASAKEESVACVACVY